jgi:Tfp pilus assembly protein PilO
MNRNVWMVLVAIILVAIIAGSWFFLLTPIREDIESATMGIDAARIELQEAQTRLAQAEGTREKGRRNQARLLALAKMVPAEQEIPSLLVQIQDIAALAGIEWMSIQPGDPLETRDVRMIPLSLEFKGTFFDVSDFVYRAEQMVAAPGRLLGVSAVKLELSGDEEEESEVLHSPMLKVDITLYAFDSAVSGSAAVPEAAPPSADEPSEVQ